jgi:hypothetical protein
VNGGIVASGTASPAIALLVGTSTVSVRVVSSDGSVNQTYSIVVTRAP